MTDFRFAGPLNPGSQSLQGAGGVALPPFTLNGPLGVAGFAGSDSLWNRPDRLLVVRSAMAQQPSLAMALLPLLLEPPSAAQPPRLPGTGITLGGATLLEPASLNAMWAEICHSQLARANALPSVLLSGPIAIDQDVFCALYQRAHRDDAHFQRMLPPDIRANLGRVLSRIGQDGALTHVRWIAYMLATALHENRSAARQWQAVWSPQPENGGRAYGGHAYFDPVDVKNRAGRFVGQDGRELADQAAATGRIKRAYYGRGFVQITFLENYAKFDEELGLANALLVDPDRALEFDIAYDIWSIGMRKGLFTGRKLADFISGADKVDYDGARAIVNADRNVVTRGETLSNGALVALHARTFERILQCSRIA